MADMTREQREAVVMCEEICGRADVLGISLAKFPVPEVREMVSALKRLCIRPIAPEPAGEVGDLVAALEFYRDDAWVAEWEGDEDGVTGCNLVPSRALTKDCGERARTALAAYTARKGGGNVG